jgi:hypothetical protein
MHFYAVTRDTAEAGNEAVAGVILCGGIIPSRSICSPCSALRDEGGLVAP